MKPNTSTVTESTTKNPKESTWGLLSNLANAQEVIQHYLNKKNQKGGSWGKNEMVSGLKILSPYKAWVQEWYLNPDPESPWTANPMD
ncbi:hypothetical protein DSO57_1011254 [Entomophthora muscae]|uniref:Uncharacterized protein n=1 Tax=Entomophthora muscae TaxID=34485 RepID=A0ACC2RXH9_9FUNG|nr:hypothetical protein DSO57_1011254 [Entomophthora muscae]